MTTRTRTSHEAETLAPVVPQRVVDAASALLERAVDAKLTIAAAESCTGGLLSALLTDVEGASHAFERGFVVYTDAAKCELLGIARNLVADCGAVSREVAVAMAEGALAQSGADFAVAVTGFAGPGGPGDEPGLVHFGCIRSGRDVVHREEHFGDIGRGPTRIACLETAIAMLNDALGAG